jgi:hypothetical protein
MIENDKMSTELFYQSKQTEDIIQENIKLKEDNKALKRKVDLLSKTEEDFSKKNQSNKQLIKSLTAALKCIYN